MERISKHAEDQLSRNRSVQRKASADSQGRDLAEQINNSSAMTAQRKQLGVMFGSAMQRVEDEEPLQGKFETSQRVEEEEPMQGKSEAASSLRLKEEAAKPNNTGLPDNLKSGIETLSGMSMDSVKVHYNSSQPALMHRAPTSTSRPGRRSICRTRTGTWCSRPKVECSRLCR